MHVSRSLGYDLGCRFSSVFVLLFEKEEPCNLEQAF